MNLYSIQNGRHQGVRPTLRFQRSLAQCLLFTFLIFVPNLLSATAVWSSDDDLIIKDETKCYETNNITISSAHIHFVSVEVDTDGNLEESDYLDVFVKVDNGNWERVSNYQGNGNSSHTLVGNNRITVESGPYCGSKLKIKVCGKTNKHSEKIKVKKRTVEKTSITSNPDLSPSCPIKIVLVLDESGSVKEEAQTIRDGAKALADALRGTTSELAIVEFSTNARCIAIDGKTELQAVDNGFMTGFENYLKNNYKPDGYTNWEAALIKTKEVINNEADMVVFFTDGNPNRWIHGGGVQGSGGDFSTTALTQAVGQANMIKNQGTKMLVLGVEENLSDPSLNVEALKAISGPTKAGSNTSIEVADYALLDFADFKQCLRDIATNICGTSIAINKTVSTTSICAGEYIEFSFEVENVDSKGNGNDAHNMVVTDELLGGYSDVSCSSCGNEDVSIDGNKVVWKVGDLAPKETKVITIKAKVKKNGSHDNTVYARASNADEAKSSIKGSDITISDLEISCEGSTLKCKDARDGSASVKAWNAAGQLSYKWYNSGANIVGTEREVKNLAAGKYTVVVTDRICEKSCEVTITQPAEELTCEIWKSENVSCHRGTDGMAMVMAWGGTGSYTYKWSSGQETQTVTGLSAGDYWVLVTDENGCTCKSRFSISQPDKLKCTITQEEYVSCHGAADASAYVLVEGGTGSYAYKWSHDQSTEAEVTNLSVGTHYVTIVDDNQCEAICSIEIKQPDKLKCEITQDESVSCQGAADASAYVLVEGGTGSYAYKWSHDQSTEAEVTNLAAGTHYVTIVDDNMCEAICTVEITEPVKLTATMVAKCIEGSTSINIDLTPTGGTEPYQYLWSGNGSQHSTQDLTSVPEGAYTIVITDANGCKFEDQIEKNGCCVFEVTCPTNTDLGTIACDETVPPLIETIAAFEAVGGTIGENPCGTIVILSVDGENQDFCQDRKVERTITIFDDGNGGELNGELDGDEPFEICKMYYTIEAPKAPTFSCLAGGDIECYSNLGDLIKVDSTLISMDVETSCGLGFLTKIEKPTFAGNCNETEYDVIYHVIDKCERMKSCTITYKIAHDLPAASAPAPLEIPACTSEDEITSAWDAWIREFDATEGGCDSKITYYVDGEVVDNLPTSNPLSSCGGEIAIKVVSENDCQQEAALAESTFTILAPEEISVMSPSNVLITECTTQEEVNMQFADWISSFGYTGGCDGAESTNIDDLEPPYICEGGIIEVLFEASDACNSDEATRTFEVNIPGSSDLSISCPAPQTENEDQTQAAIDMAFEIWKSEFISSGGCNKEVTFFVEGMEVNLASLEAPDACGGDITVEMVVETDCQEESCESEFIVIATAQGLILSFPEEAATCHDELTPPTFDDIPEFSDVYIEGQLIVSPCAEGATFEISTMDMGPTIDGTEYTFERLYKIEASNGLFTEAIHKVVINFDILPPVITGAPDNLLLPCGSDLPEWPNVSATDNSGKPIVVVRNEVAGGTNCGGKYYIRSWTATDECQNTMRKEQRIRFEDNDAPTLIVAADTTVDCSDNVPVPTYDATDDGCSTFDVTFEENRIDLNSCEYDLIRTWVATDGCYNSVVKTQVIHVVDTVAPIITPINPMLVGMTSGSEMIMRSCGSPQVAMGDVSIEDCCSDLDVETADDLLSVGGCDLWGYHRKWRCSVKATDAAGNVSEFYFYVLQYDEEAPEIHNVPASIQLECGDTIPDVPTDVLAVDNCNGESIPNFSETPVLDSIDSTVIAVVRTWWSVDHCGNRGEETQIITLCDFDTSSISASIGSTVWLDANRNGIQDLGETGLNDVKVYLYRTGENHLTTVDSTVTTRIDGQEGQFNFDHLTADTYQLQFACPEDMKFTLIDRGNDDNLDSDADQVTGMTSVITVARGAVIQNNTAGFVAVESSQSESAGFVSFVASTYRCETTLTWTAKGLDHIEQFVVEKSSNGRAFERLDEIKITNSDAYHFTDDHTGRSATYRILLMGIDGTSFYSNLQNTSAKCRIANKDGLTIFPNPVRTYTNLGFTLPNSMDVTISLVDQLGQVVKKETKYLYKGENVESVDLSQVPIGTYIIQVNMNDYIESKILIKSQ